MLGGVALIVLVRVTNQLRRLLIVGVHCVLPAKVAPPEDVRARADLGDRHWAIVAEATQGNCCVQAVVATPAGRSSVGSRFVGYPGPLPSKQPFARSTGSGLTLAPGPISRDHLARCGTTRIERAAGVPARVSPVSPADELLRDGCDNSVPAAPTCTSRRSRGQDGIQEDEPAQQDERGAEQPVGSHLLVATRGRITTGRSPARNPPRTT